MIINSLVEILLAPIAQDPHYHAFADSRALFGVPNWWNVVSNLPFLLAAVWGLRALGRPSVFREPWERFAYIAVLAGTAAVAVGSAYYHLRPTDETLFWDRLPMTVVFMSILAATVGERVALSAGRLLLAPLLLMGCGSVVYWRTSGDLRLYALVQFGAVILVPLLLLSLPPLYTGTTGVWCTVGFYLLAKVFERLDGDFSAHPWKHVAAAAAMLCYVETVARRRPATGGVR